MAGAIKVKPGEPVDLSNIPTRAPASTHREKAEATFAKLAGELSDLQEMLYASSSQALLVILQGLDTSGKDGAISHVFREVNPQGCDVASFKVPTPVELAHDFLWRVHQRAPAKGMIGIFNRSHYEDVLVVRVHELVPQAEWEARYDAINEFEAELVDGGTTVLKCFLNISFDTQRERLLARLDDPDKHWKFNEGDLEQRARWMDYQAAFSDMLERCNTASAPWYVVPSDHKKYRNWAIGELLRETLVELDPQYPRPALDVPALRAQLAPPH